MGARFSALAERARASRVWLRERGLVTLAAAVLLEVSAAAPGGRPSSRAAFRALVLVLLLSIALVAIAMDGLLSLLFDRTRAGAVAAGRYAHAGSIVVARSVRARAIALTHDVRERSATAALQVRAARRQRPPAVPAEVAQTLLLDKRGRPLRGKAREVRLAAIQRERERAARARTLAGRAEILVAKVRARVAPYTRRVVSVGSALEARVLAIRAWVIRSVERASVRVTSLLARAVTPFRERILAPLAARAALLWSRARLQTTPRIARLRRELAASSARAAAAARAASLGVARAIERGGRLTGAIPVPRIRVPVPALSLRTLRVVTVGVTLSFVFATAIGTTGLIAQRGTVALGASTTLTIISGEVTVLAPGATEFAPAVDGDVLQAGMTIRTSGSSYAVLTYFEGSTVSIDPETTLVIEALQAHPDGSTVIEMRQDVGRTWHAVAKLLSPGSKYTVRTPTATASVRGTLFLVGVALGPESIPVTLIETTEGAVAAERPPTAAAPQGEEVIVPAGFQVEAKPAEVIPPAVPTPEAQQTVTVTIGAAGLVLDSQGRANGVTPNGKKIIQTPGAQVETVDGKTVVTMKNVEGKVPVVIAPTAPAAEPPAPIQVVTVVTEKGKGEARSEETVQRSTTAPTVTGVDVKKAEPDKAPEIRKLDEAEKQNTPPVKVAEVPKPAEARKTDDDAKKADGDTSEAPPSAQGGGARTVVQAFAQLTTLPPLSAEELARREAERRKAEEKARQEGARREEERRAEEKKKIEDLRDAEERAKREAARLAEERKRAEGRAGDERQRSDDRGREQTERRDEERRNAPEAAPAPAPVAAIQQIIKAIASQGDDAPKREQDDRSRDAERQAEELRRAETKAKEEAAKAEDARRKAEERERQDSIKREEERRRESEKKAEELRRVEERAKEEAQRKIEELRRLEEKAREQAAKLDEEKRRESERRLEDFRRQEEQRRQQEAKRIEEMRRAEERAREQAEERLRELRRDEERAREEQRRRDDDRRREDDERRRDDEDRRRFVPTETLKPLPGVGSRSSDEEGKVTPRGDADRDEDARAQRPKSQAQPKGSVAKAGDR